MNRTWQKAHNNIVDALWSIKFASDITSSVLKNDKTSRSQPFMRPMREIDSTPNEFEVVNINHDREERMPTIMAYWEKYSALKLCIERYRKAKTEIVKEIDTEREFFNNLYFLRKRYAIQDATMMLEFKHKKQQIQKINNKTLYCHVIYKPELYIPKSKKNYLNKVLLVQGKNGGLEYRCHPLLRKTFKMVTEVDFKIKNPDFNTDKTYFHRQKEIFTFIYDGNNTDWGYENLEFIKNITKKLSPISLYNCIDKELSGIEYFKNHSKYWDNLEKTPFDHKKFNEMHTKFTRDQYELVKKVTGICSEPHENQKIIKLNLNLSYDMSISLWITLDFIDSSTPIDNSMNKIIEGDDYNDPIIGRSKLYSILDACISRDNTNEIIILDLMSILSQKYISHILHKIASPKLSLGFEFHYSEPNFFKYHINQFQQNRGSEVTTPKRNTVIILEVDCFRMVLNVKTRPTSDTE